MWPVSAAFLAACRAGSQHVRSRAELWRDGAKAADVTSTAGQVDVDRGRDIRRTVTATLLDVDGTLTPNDASDLLVPAGTQLRCWRGLVLPGGAFEEVPLGVYRIIDPQVEVTSDGATQISVSGQDESMTVAAARLTSGYRIPAGTGVGAGLAALLTDRHPRLDVADRSPDVRFAAAVDLPAGADSDPWTQAKAIAAAHGLDIDIDPEGTAVIRPVPNPVAADAAYRRGADAVITKINRGYTTENTYSGVCVKSEPTDAAPVQATVWDTNPASPTYAAGRFGRKPLFITSQLLTTVGQAEATARAWLPIVSGILERVTWEQVVNPAHDVFDVVDVEDPDVNLSARLTIDQLTIPLDHAGVMAAVTRSRTLTETVLP